MKAKKVLAMLMASAMIMGTSVTAFAATNTNSIKVVNLGEAATVKCLQIIKPDTTSPTGWKFVDSTIENAYVGGFNTANPAGPTHYTAEEVIWMLLESKTPNSNKIPEKIEAASASQIQKGVEAIESLSEGVVWEEMTVSGTVATKQVEEAGIYAIKADDGDDGTENDINYVYSAMAAYVSFAAYDDGTGVPSSLESEDVNAKKTTISISKDSDEEGDVVAIGDEVTYTINTVVPYIKDDVTNVVYNITDKLTGAEYVVSREEAGKKYIALKVKVGTSDWEDYEAEIKPTMDAESVEQVGEQFTVDLSSIAAIRTNANQSLTIKYQADVTNEIVNNTVQPNKGDHDFDKLIDGDTLYTGKITMTKYGEDKELLENAEFVLYYDNATDGKRYYATFTQDAEKQEKGENEYVLSGWIEVDEKDKDTVPDGVTHIVTDSDGTAVVRGLDDDATYGYMFKEVVAPKGYSINTNDAPIDRWDGNADARATTADMNDTKLSSLPLPSTGGIGTTLFTVGGCTIMVVAAGLYFATRKKEEN